MEELLKQLADLEKKVASKAGLESAETEIKALKAEIDKMKAADETEKSDALKKLDDLTKKLSDMEKQVEAVDVKVAQMKPDFVAENADGIKADKDKASRAFVKALVSSRNLAQFHDRIKALTDGQNITENADGGYLVPAPLAAQILEDIFNEMPANMAPIPTINMGKNLKINVISSPATCKRYSEGGATDESKLQFRQVELDAQRISALVQWTWEFANLTEGGAVAEVSRLVAQAFSAQMLYELFNGLTASKQYEGILTNAALIAAATETEVAGTIDADDLVNLESAMKLQRFASLRYIMDRRTLGALRKIRSDDGRAYVVEYVNGVPTINSIPVVVTGAVYAHNGTSTALRSVLSYPTGAGVFTGGTYPIVLANMEGYIQGMASNMVVMPDSATGASEAIMKTAWHMWNNGKVRLPDYMALLKVKSGS